MEASIDRWYTTGVTVIKSTSPFLIINVHDIQYMMDDNCDTILMFDHDSHPELMQQMLNRFDIETNFRSRRRGEIYVLRDKARLVIYESHHGSGLGKGGPKWHAILSICYVVFETVLDNMRTWVFTFTEKNNRPVLPYFSCQERKLDDSVTTTTSQLESSEFHCTFLTVPEQMDLKWVFPLW